jgi:hypothetical protein
MDFTVLGIVDLIAAALVAGVVSAVLSWRFPMAPLASAVVAGGLAAGLVLAIARPMPGLVVVAGGLLAAGAGLLHDRAVVPRWALVLLEIVIAAATITVAVPLPLLMNSLQVELPAPVQVVVAALLIAVAAVGLRRADRLPGLAAAISAAVAAFATFLAVLAGVGDYPTIWWLAALALVTAGLSIVARARATPLGSTGTSYLTLTIGVLILGLLSLAF